MTAAALLGFTAWMLFLAIAIWSRRSWDVLFKAMRSNEFAPDGSTQGPFDQRLNRAYLNCTEAAVPFAGLLLYAIATDQTYITDTLALPMLAARLLQGGVHLTSTSAEAVNVRFAFFVFQNGVQLYWLVRFFDVL